MGRFLAGTADATRGAIGGAVIGGIVAGPEGAAQGAMYGAALNVATGQVLYRLKRHAIVSSVIKDMGKALKLSDEKIKKYYELGTRSLMVLKKVDSSYYKKHDAGAVVALGASAMIEENAPEYNEFMRTVNSQVENLAKSKE